MENSNETVSISISNEEISKLLKMIENAKKSKKKYVENNREKINKYKREYYKNKYNTDEEYRLKRLEITRLDTEKRKEKKKQLEKVCAVQEEKK